MSELERIDGRERGFENYILCDFPVDVLESFSRCARSSCENCEMKKIS
jgi:hypothetical protein